VAHWAEQGLLQPPAEAAVPPARGPVLLMVGSLSPVTTAQIEHAQGRFFPVEVEPALLLGDDAAIEVMARRCAGELQAGRSVMCHTPRLREAGAPALAVAQLCARVVARVLELAPQVRRVGVAGGDSSSHAAAALGIWGLEYVAQLAPGVPLVRARSHDAVRDGRELMLKGGQMGPLDLFLRLAT